MTFLQFDFNTWRASYDTFLWAMPLAAMIIGVTIFAIRTLVTGAGKPS